MLLYHSLAVGLAAFGTANAQAAAYPTNLVGTWASKSNQTLTGPGFYDPLNDRLIEPARTGISYSFTSDGHYEEAYYRAISNPADPACPSAIMQWQHGSYVYLTNGSLALTPIAVDGRQLLSEPCVQDYSTYTRYNQTELFKQYSVYIDPYHGIPRLDLYGFNGEPMQPLYLAFSPPEMLPTTTLNPITSTATATGTGTAGAATAAAASKQRRRSARVEREIPAGWAAAVLGEGWGSSSSGQTVLRINADRLWWLGLAMTGVGGLLYFGPRRLGM